MAEKLREINLQKNMYHRIEPKRCIDKKMLCNERDIIQVAQEGNCNCKTKVSAKHGETMHREKMKTFCNFNPRKRKTIKIQKNGPRMRSR